MTGSSNLTNVVNDSSIINFTAPTGDPTLLASYKTLSTTNYTGVGGSMAINTFLEATARPLTGLSSAAGPLPGTHWCMSPTSTDRGP